MTDTTPYHLNYWADYPRNSYTDWIAQYMDMNNAANGYIGVQAPEGANPWEWATQQRERSNQAKADLASNYAYRNPNQTMDQAMAAYNAGSRDIDPRYLAQLARAQGYFHGDATFAPGTQWANSNTLQSAINQWGRDDAPSFLDKIGPLLPLALGGAAALGLGAGGASELAGATQAAAPVTDAVFTPVVESAAGGAGGGAGYFGGIGGGSGSGMLGSEIASGAGGAGYFGGIGGASSAVPGIGLTGAAGAAPIVGGSLLSSLGLNGAGGQALGAIAGGILGATNGSKKAGTTTSTLSPWEPMQPYMLDAAKAAQDNWNAQKNFTPQQEEILGQAQKLAAAQLSNPAFGSLQTAAQGALNGTLFSPVQSVGNAATANGAQAQFSLGSLGMGGAPQDAYNRLLSGKVDTTTLSPVVDSALRRLTDNFNENVLNNIGGAATVSGQYGGSRHGIAEGLAAKGLALSMGDTSANMYNNAYQNAQQLMGNAAGQLGGFATSIANANANNATQASIANANAQNNMMQFNANLGLQNNAQKLAQMNAGMDWLNSSNNMQNTAIKNSLDLANYKNTYANDALKNYAGTVGTFGGLGKTETQPYYTNPTAGLLGGAVSGAQLFKNIFS